MSSLVQKLEGGLVLLLHAIQTSDTFLDGGGEFDVGGGLNEGLGVEFSIIEATDNGIRGGDIALGDFTPNGGRLRC